MANAASVHTVRWLNYFAEKGWNIHLITWHKASAENPSLNKKITLHKIFFAPHYAARYLALCEISFLIGKIKPNIIHAHYLSHFGILAGLFGKITGFKPIILSAWGSDILIDAKGFKKFLINEALQIADCVHCDGDNVRQILIEWGIAKEKLNLIGFGIDTHLFAPRRKSVGVKTNLGIVDEPVVISTRNLTPLYDVQTLIKAIPIIGNYYPNTKYIIIGRGSEEKKLKNLAVSLEISESIRFLGFIPNNQLPDYLSLADIYVSTSTSDSGLASSTAEAMSCGLPVLISDLGDNAEWVKEGVNGFVFPTGDFETLARKIVYLLSNSQLRNDIGRIGREMFLNKTSREKEMVKVEMIYRELIERYHHK